MDAARWRWHTLGMLWYVPGPNVHVDRSEDALYSGRVVMMNPLKSINVPSSTRSLLGTQPSLRVRLPLSKQLLGH